tara:strand:+ start:65 stop:1075 length:1011 start_codon:yes stop_codon:yes gene_type:complete
MAKKKRKKRKKTFAQTINKRKKPFRNVVEDGVTYSFLDEWLLDREQARLSYVEGWSSKGLAVPLDFGLAFHDCLEWVAKGRSPKTIHKKVIAPYLEKRLGGKNKLRPDEVIKLTELLRSVEVVFQEYASYWEKYDADMQYIYQEKSFKVDHTLPSGKDMPLRGRWDAVYKENGKIWLMENKTKGQIDEEGILASLPFDLQTMLYVHTLQEHLGQKVEGVLYNVIRRPGLRRRKTEQIGEFIDRIQDDVVKRPQHYFMRWRVEFLSEDIKTWVSKSLNPILEQVMQWWESIQNNPFEPWDSPLHYQNPTALFTRYGRSRYFDLITKNTSVGLYQREN